MSTFLGIGLGPIQTGIFLSGAHKGKMDRLVVADVDANVVNALRASQGKITINIAASDKVYQETISGVEIYNPLDEQDRKKLIDIAAEADELATALPGVDFFKHITPWLKEGFVLDPEKRRFIYTAENNNHAAEFLSEALGNSFPNTHCLNTVVGKMSGIVSAKDCIARGLLPLSSEADRGHLIEEFNQILISSAPGINKRKVQGLFEKSDLYPFEEAKLYGHNAIHFLLAVLGKIKGCAYMNELVGHPTLLACARDAFIYESGKALCRKWQGVDELFTERGFAAYAEDLLTRMTNPFLTDAIDRVTRDLPRKMAWNDRVVGTMRLVLSQGGNAENISKGAVWGAQELFGDNEPEIRKGFQELWPSPWTDEHENLLKLITGQSPLT
jgi:hypothetical protein